MKKILILFLLIFSISFFSTDIIVSQHTNSNNHDVFSNKFNPEIALISNNTIKILNTNNGDFINYYETTSNPVKVLWMDEEKYFVSGNVDGTIEVFLKDSALFNFKIRLSQESILDMASFDKNIIFSSSDKRVYIYDVSKRKLLFSKNFSNTVNSVGIFDEKIAFVGDSAGFLHKINYEENEVNSIKVSSTTIRNIFFMDGKIFVFSFDGKINIYDKNFNLLINKSLHLPVLKAEISQDNKYIAVLYSNNTLEIINSKNFYTLNLFDGESLNINSISWSSENKEEIFIVDKFDVYKKGVFENEIIPVHINKGLQINKIFWLDDYIIYSEGMNNISYMNTKTGNIEITINLKQDFSDFDIDSKNSRVVVSDSSGNISIFELFSGRLLKKIRVTNSRLTKIKLNPAFDYVVTGGWDNILYLYSYPDLKLVNKIEKIHNNWIKDIDFNNSGDKLAVSSLDKKVVIYSNFPDINERNTLILSDFRYNIWSLDWANNSDLLALGGFEGVLEVWDVQFRSRYARSGFITGPINKIQWSSNDKNILMGSEDKNIYLWSTEKLQLLNVFSNPVSHVKDVQWNKGGRFFAAIGGENNIRIWDINSNKSIANVILFDDEKYVSFTFTGEYVTNVRNADENKYFYKYNPTPFFETIKFQKVESLNLRNTIKPEILTPDIFVFNLDNPVLNISIFGNNLINTVRIGSDNYNMSDTTFSIDYKINIEKLESRELKILAYDDAGNLSEKSVEIILNNIILYVITNQAFVKDAQGNIIGVLTRGTTVELYDIEKNFYVINYNGLKGYVEKAYMIIQ